MRSTRENRRFCPAGDKVPHSPRPQDMTSTVPLCRAGRLLMSRLCLGVFLEPRPFRCAVGITISPCEPLDLDVLLCKLLVDCHRPRLERELDVLSAET